MSAPNTPSTSTVTVVGAGMAGASCAVALAGAGVAVRLVERGRAPGGRLAAPTVHGRRVDLGAAYLTAGDDDFRRVVDDWCDRGLLREWTDTLDVLTPSGRQDPTTGPMRYAAPDGLRSLVRDLLTDHDVTLGEEVTTLPDGPVVLAMPDPQALRVVPGLVDAPVDWEPVVAVALGYAERSWDLDAAAFVNDHPDVSLVADDGSRRGDGAPVLVVHTTAPRARQHLDDPAGAVPVVVAAVRDLLGVTAEPEWTHPHRWTFARPADTHGDAAYLLTERDGRPVGVCGDAWCPSGSPRVESAWLSGRALARALIEASAPLG